MIDKDDPGCEPGDSNKADEAEDDRLKELNVDIIKVTVHHFQNGECIIVYIKNVADFQEYFTKILLVQKFS